MISIGYGRVSSSKRARDKSCRRQLKAIKRHFHISKLDFDFDESSNKKTFDQRPALKRQLCKVAAYEVPLHIEHSDHLIKSYDDRVIHSFIQYLDLQAVSILYAYPNTWFHQRIIAVLSKDIPTSGKRRLVIRLVDQYLKYRHQMIVLDGRPDPLPERKLYRDLEHLRYFPALTKCADHLLGLDTTSDRDRYRFFVDAYLGAASNHKHRLNGHPSVPSGQLTYGELPEHTSLFDAVHQVASRPHVTRYNRPKRVSDAIVARTINNLGFRNFRGNPFSRKSVWQLRHHPAYRRHTEPNRSTTPEVVNAG